MILKKYLVFLFVCLCFVGIAQETKIKAFTLDWDMTSNLSASSGEQWTLPLIKNNSVNSDGLPIFISVWSIDKGMNKVSYSLKNIVFETVDPKYLKSLSVQSLSEQVKSSLHISKSPESNDLTLELYPLIVEAGKVKKVVSFDLEYTLTSLRKKTTSSFEVKNSVLSKGTWYKFAIDRTGVFKIDYEFLYDLGVSISRLDPKNIRIFGNGGAMLPNLNAEFRYDDLQENDIYVSGESDGSFDKEDYILFYTKGPHDWNTPSENSITHRKNIYSEESYYFITIDNGPGARINPKSPVESVATDQISTFKDYLFKEDDLVNLFSVGQQWFGDSYETTNVRTYNFDFPNIDTSKDLYIKVRGVAKSSVNTSMKVSLNENKLFDLNYSFISNGGFVKADEATNSINTSVNSSSLAIKIEYNNNGNPSSEAYLDYIEVIGDKFLKANGNQFSFRNFLSQSSDKVLEYTIENNSNIDMVWDVTDFLHPKQVYNQNKGSSNFSFKEVSGELNEYVVLNNSDYYTPTIIRGRNVVNQNLHALKDIEYLVVTRKELFDEAQRLATYHEENSNLSSKVVTISEIYNEFGSGSPDITAIRDFVKHLYDSATSLETRVRYVCMFGDSTYDYKDRISNNNNVVPVYLAYNSFSLTTSFVTDDYYGMMDDHEGNMLLSDKQDVATGRVLVSNLSQAKNVVDKILNAYSKKSLGGWRNTLTLISDDMENASEYILQEDMERIATLISEKAPQYNLKKIYADSYKQVETSAGGRYPDVNTAISNAVEKGSLVISYFGHGGESGLGHEWFLKIPDIKSWVNVERSPLFITVTCDFSKFDDPAHVVAGEEMILSKIGGTTSLVSTTREVFIYYGRSFNYNLIEGMLDFNESGYSIAEALMHTKNRTPSSSKQHFFIFSLGDPAMKLGIPRPNIKVTKINEKDITVSRDTLKGLSKVKIEGVVTDVGGNVLTDYNAVLSTIIFDKPTKRSTLNNDNFYADDEKTIPLIMTFEVQESAIFRGNAEVVNGIFSYEFVVPKDIKVSYGKSKISLYANDGKGSKGGLDLETIIGGVDDSADYDGVGPEIELYLNDETFVNGGNTSATPSLIARFSDANGINTSLGAIGHAITVTIDGNEAEPIQLNDFYESELGDYTKGNVNYTLRNLEAGPHSLKVKVFDTHNNGSEKTLDFIVTKSSDFVLEKVLNYPNPFVNFTEFWFTHNQPNEILDVSIYIYSISGKLVKSINDVVQTTGSLSRSITWDGKDNFGEKIGKGVYIYKIEVTNISSGISAEKIEKLVILQ